MSATAASNGPVSQKYLTLPQKGSIIAEYVWIDASGGVRSKCKTLPKAISKVSELPVWNFDGSSTEQAPGSNSDVYLKPVAFYPDPFRQGDNILVMADCWMANGSPNSHNFRADADKLMEAYKAEEFWFGLEQEYTLLDPSGWPYGWPTNGFPGPQGPYYCGVGATKVFGRDIAEAHYKACLYAGIQISGTNAEVMPAQWEFQVGPCLGISLSDELWMARFILQRVSEDFGVIVTFNPKPIPGEWNGAGLHSNISTKAMRADGGIKVIEAAMEKLSTRHTEHMTVYGTDNDKRMTGKCETATYDKFSWGVANRGASVRVNRSVAEEGKGYFEDRRPASNADPYCVTGIIVETLCGKVDGVDMARPRPPSFSKDS
jgi:glutamine synthetase